MHLNDGSQAWRAILSLAPHFSGLTFRAHRDLGASVVLWPDSKPLKRFPALSRTPNTPLKWGVNEMVRGATSIPITLSP